MKTNINYQGVFPAIPTMFSKNGDLELDDLKRTVRFLVDKEVNGIFSLVIGGEFYKLSDKERMTVAEQTVKYANGDLPVFVGVTHSGLLPSIYLAKHAESIGADGIVVSYPYFAPFIQEARAGLMKYISDICDAVDIDVIVQDYRSHKSISFTAKQISQLVNRHRNISALKIEGTGHLEKIKKYFNSPGRKIPILGGMVGKYFLEELKSGVVGTVPGAAIPETYLSIYDLFLLNHRDEAMEKQSKLDPYLDYVISHFVSFVDIEKRLLKRRGIINSIQMREPRIVMQESDLSSLEAILNNIEQSFKLDFSR